MAKARSEAAYDALTNAYRARLTRKGISRADYVAGKPLSAARGHAETPEHGLKDAKKNPARYGDYLKRRPGGTGKSGQVSPGAVTPLRQKTFEHIDGRLRNYLKYNEDNVHKQVFGDSNDPDKYPGYSEWLCRETLSKNTEEIRELARKQYEGNPWWYH